MRCYDCATQEKAEEAVGSCALCGRGVCLEHSRLERAPQYRNSGGGIAGPLVHASRDRVRLLCAECGGNDEGSLRGR